MDKELPWLADNAQLELKYKKGKTPLSHRRWPGEPVSVITEVSSRHWVMNCYKS